MRHPLLAIVDGNFYYETLVIFQVGDVPVIWFRRDGAGSLRLNVRACTPPRGERSETDGDSLRIGETVEFECPESREPLSVHCGDDQELTLQFFELADAAALRERHPNARAERWPLTFPVMAVELSLHTRGARNRPHSRRIALPGSRITGAFCAYSKRGIDLRLRSRSRTAR